jgi:hypothetical protein
MAKLDIKYKDNFDLCRKYLEILSPILGLNNKEKEILAQIMIEDISRRDIALKDRYRIILSYEGRIEICNNLDISGQTLRNALAVFRKKNYLVRNKNNEESLAPYFRISIENLKEITFNFIKDGAEK